MAIICLNALFFVALIFDVIFIIIESGEHCWRLEKSPIISSHMILLTLAPSK